MKDIIKALDNKYASRASDGLISDTENFIDTGSYNLNALLSADIYGGMPDNKVLGLAGESTTGKTFFALGICKHFLDANKDAVVFFFESEGAITKSILEDRGIDLDRFFIIPVSTVEEFRTQAIKLLDKIEAKKDSMPQSMICLDSLGMLSTSKEVTDVTEGSDKKDMTRPGLIRGAFRVISLRQSMLRVPMIVTNHTYDNIGGYGSPVKMGGGKGLHFAADQIIFLSKAKDKDGTQVTGNIITCSAFKSRLTVENTKVPVRLTYRLGLDRYYGLVDTALAAEIWHKEGNMIMVDGKKTFRKTIESNPEKYFTQEILEKINEYIGKQFRYSSTT